MDILFQTGKLCFLHFRQRRKGDPMILKLEEARTILNEPRSEKTGLRGFRPGPTQTSLYSHRRWLEA